MSRLWGSSPNRRRDTPAPATPPDTPARLGHSDPPADLGRQSNQGPIGTWDGAGENTVSQTEYAQRCKAIIQLYQDLKPLTAHHLPQFQFPKVVVIGGQSTGKSSLVEAVSGIKAPRDAGTCTRCPMECTMSASASWSCDVHIDWAYDRDGDPLPSNQCHVETFGPTLTDPRQMELWIRRAQAAILSQGYRPSSEFKGMTADQLTEEKSIDDPRRLNFSKNVIRVHLRDPDATELSFVDLPGLVQNVGSQNLVKLVADLVKSSIADKETLILIAIPMTEDIEGQGAVSLAKEADPHGSRIIGVLTKPDMLTEGSVGAKKLWSSILANHESPHWLQHGYYCVRLLDDAQREQGISRAEAERIGESFFDDTEPWKSMQDRSRFGIPNLVKSLSTLLIERIQAKLPELRRIVKKALKKTQKDLDSLPAPPAFGNKKPSTEVLLRITKFCNEFDAVVRGDVKKKFVQDNRSVYGEFNQEILRTAPNFCPSVNKTQYPVATLVPKSNQDPIDLTAVRTAIAEATAWELPGILPFEAIKALILQHVAKWAAPSRRCFTAISLNTSKVLEELLNKHVGQFPYLKIYIGAAMGALQHDVEVAAREALEKRILAEMGPVFTQNVDCYVREESNWLTSYTNSASSHGHYNVNTTHSQEFTVISKVQAYFQVAYKRYVDDIPLNIEHELNQALSSKLQASLFEEVLQAIDDNSLDDLLVEDHTVARKRAALKGRIAKLKQIVDRLEAFGSEVQFDWDASDSEASLDEEVFSDEAPISGLAPVSSSSFDFALPSDSLEPAITPRLGSKKKKKGKGISRHAPAAEDF